MATKVKVGIVLAGLALAAGALLLWPEVDEPSRAAPDLHVEQQTDPAGSTSRRKQFDGDRSEQSERVRIEPEEGRHARSAAPGFATARVDGRFVNAAGAPVPDVAVMDLGSPNLIARSRDDGRFEGAASVVESRGGEVHLRGQKDGYKERYLAAKTTHSRDVHFGDVILELAATGAVSGVVVDRNGAPVPAAWVGWTGAGSLDSILERARLTGDACDPMDRRGRCKPNVDPAGTFRLEEVEAGQGRVAATAAGFLYTFSDIFEVRAREEHGGIRLVLDPVPLEKLVNGIVLDPFGRPVAGANIKVTCRHDGSSCSSSILGSDAAGRFSYVLGEASPHTFEARLFLPPGAGAADAGGEKPPRSSEPPLLEKRYEPARVDNVVAGTPRLILQFAGCAESKLHLPLTVTTPAGDSPDLMAIETCPAADGMKLARRMYLPPYKQHSRDENGRFLLPAPEEPFLIVVEAAGFQRAVAGPYDPAWYSEARIVLQPLSQVKGQVFADGKPFAGAKVGLYPAVPPTIAQTINGFLCWSTCWSSAEGETREDGRVSLWLRESGRYFVRADAEGWASSAVGPLDIDHVLGAEGLRIDLTRGGTLEGFAVPRPGESPEGVIVAISRGDGFAGTVRTDARGFFRFDHLTPGLWQVDRSEKELNLGGGITCASWSTDSPPAIPWSCTVEEGKTTRYDLDLSAERMCVKGVLEIAGGDFAGGRAALYATASGSPVSSAKVARDGRFTVKAPLPGEYRLMVEGGRAGRGHTSVRDLVTLGVDATTWEYRLPTGQLEIRGLQPNDRGIETYLYWKGSGNLEVFVTIDADGSGSALLSAAPAGQGKIRRLGRSRENRRNIDEVLAEVTVLEGGVAEVDLTGR